MHGEISHGAGLVGSQLLAEPSSCPICGHPRLRRRTPGRNLRDGLDVLGAYYGCRQCGHRILHPLPSKPDLDRYYRQAREQSAGDPSSLEGSNRLLRRIAGKLNSCFTRSDGRYWQAHHYLPPDPPPGARLLELGCGTGDTLRNLMDRGYAVAGLDVSPAHVETCSRSCPDGDFWVDDLENLAREEGGFEFARMDNVLEHILNPLPALQSAHRLLRTGGQLAIYVPNADSLSLALLRSRSISHWVPFHLHLFTLRSLAHALLEAGFVVRRQELLTPPTWWFLSVAQLLGPASVQARLCRSGNLNALLHLAAWPLRAAGLLVSGEEVFILAEKPGANPP